MVMLADAISRHAAAIKEANRLRRRENGEE
jgi:hypothetical protein